MLEELGKVSPNRLPFLGSADVTTEFTSQSAMIFETKVINKIFLVCMTKASLTS